MIAVAVHVVDEVAIATARQRALGKLVRVHFGIHVADEVRTFFAQHLQEVLGYDAFEDHVALIGEQLSLLVGNEVIEWSCHGSALRLVVTSDLRSL